MVHNRMVREPEQKKPLSVLRATVLESAINTYTEAAIPTPVSAAYFQAMRIHQIRWELDVPEGIAATETRQDAHLHTRSQTTISGINGDGAIDRVGVIRALTAASNSGTDFRCALGDSVRDFGEQGLLVTDSELWIATKSVNQAASKRARIAIYYTLETLQPDEYIAALSLLGSQL